jgi:hypothetical protein
MLDFNQPCGKFLLDMALPNIHITISRNVVAFYGAVFASITATVQLTNFLKDRVRVKIQVQHDMQVVGEPNAGKNIGRLPVITVIRKVIVPSGISSRKPRKVRKRRSFQVTILNYLLLDQSSWLEYAYRTP